MTKNKQIGLALGGGAVLGAAHIGVLKALEELEISIHYVAGTSIGAFVAAFYAFDKTWKEIEEIALKLKWIDISGISLSQYGLLSNEKPNNIVDVMVNSFHFTLQASAKLQTKEADLLIQPDLSSFNRSDMDQVEDLIDKGYEDSISILKDIV